MDKRTTPASREARLLLQKVSTLAPGESVFHESPYAAQVRSCLLKLMRDHREFQGVRTALVDGGVRVLRPQRPYVHRLEEWVRKAMLYIDDENLYDEALALLEERYVKA